MLISNAGEVLRRAWSVRLMILAAVLSGLDVALQFFGDWLPWPRWAGAAAIGLVSCAALFARFVAQKGLSKP